MDVEREHGQAMIEFSLILLVFLMLTVGLIDAGRSIFLYNEIASIARFGARWGSVVGGTCNAPLGLSNSDWCNQLGTHSGNFWSQAGNVPIQSMGTPCPSYTAGNTDYYTASSYSSSTTTTIVGAVANRFDSDANSSSFFHQLFGPGVDLSQLHVCVATTNATTTPPEPGDTVTISVAYPFTPAGKLLGTGSVNITATAQYVIE
jgi:hypothetical protein